MVDASTGLTQLGARAYDADLGRFISVDPLMDLADSQQMHGYAYANNNPVTFSDSDGLILCQSPSVPDCAPVNNSDGNTVRHVYTGPNGFNSPSHAAGSAYGGGSRPIRAGWTRIPSWGGPIGSPGPWASAPAPKPAPAPVPVSATVSPEDQALNNAKQDNGNWFQNRYTNDNGGGLDWGNILGDAGLALGIAGMFACPICGALGMAGAALSVGSGAWHFSQGNSGSGVWGVLGGVPIVGAVGVRSVTMVRGASAQKKWLSSITTNNGVVRKRKKVHKWANAKLQAAEGSIASMSSSVSGTFGHIGTNISIGGVAYNEADAFQN